METPSFKEDHISQIPALQLLQNLGYKYLTPEEALQLRGNKTTNVLLDDSKRFDIQVQLMSLAAQIDSRLEPHPISHDDFHSGNPFVAEIRRTGIEIAA